MAIRYYPDRQWIEREYLPNLYGKVLFVGVAEYTKHYSNLIPAKTIWHTLDVNRKAVDITANKHYVSDFLDINFNTQYDHIALYGLWGTTGSYNNDPSIIVKNLEKAKTLIKPNGTILVGIGCLYGVFSEHQCKQFYTVFNDYKTLYLNKLNKAYIYWGENENNTTKL